MSAGEAIDHTLFHEPDADCILISNDGVRFNTYAFLLRQASPVFRDMFSLARTSQSYEPVYIDDGSDTIEAILRMISAMPIMPVKSFNTVESLLRFSDKYDMPGPQSIVRQMMRSPELQTHPLQMYRLAYHYGWKDEALLAARLSLRLPLSLRTRYIWPLIHAQ